MSKIKIDRELEIVKLLPYSEIHYQEVKPGEVVILQVAITSKIDGSVIYNYIILEGVTSFHYNTCYSLIRFYYDGKEIKSPKTVADFSDDIISVSYYAYTDNN